jgi:hypothetical protein
VPDLDDLRGVSLAALHALTNAAMIVGVPMLIGRRIAAGRAPLAGPGPLTTAMVATVVAATLTVATRRTAWGLVRLWLRMDEPARHPSGR